MNEKNLPDVIFHMKESEIRQIREYQLITPLFGGGVEPNKADPISTVRATEIRGHLRFWWRATQLGRFSTLEELRHAENQLWGSTDIPSKVIIFLISAAYDENKTESAYKVYGAQNNKTKTSTSKNIPSYAAFPLQPETDEREIVGWESEKPLMDVKFEMNIQFPEDNKKEIEDCLWAWETFGGIGARTRRGFGAIRCVSIDGIESKEPDQDSFEDYFKENLEKHTNSPNTSHPIWGIPFLSCDPVHFRTFTKKTDPIKCWKDSIGRLRKFRQDKVRNKKGHGVSLWPEANAIRDKFGIDPKFPKGSKNHKLIKKFPRGKFGLPINFHMPHDKSIEEVILLGKEKDDTWLNRLASPVIIRSLKYKDYCVGLAVILQWKPKEDRDGTYTPPGGFYLKGTPDEDKKVYSDLAEDEISEIPVMNQTDILKAFLDFFKTNGGK